MMYLLNSSLLTSFGKYSYTALSKDEARSILGDHDKVVSALGHQGIVDLVNTLFDSKFEMNRIMVSMAVGDAAVVVKPGFRLAEGQVLSKDELASMPIEIGLLTREA